MFLLDPLQFEYMRAAISIGVLLGILGAVAGSYLIVQQMTMIGGVISHSVVPGLAIAFTLGLNLGVGAFIAGVLSALFVTLLQLRSTIKSDAAMSLTLSSFLASGILLIHWLKAYQVDLESILFGDILSVTPLNVAQTGAIAAFVLLLVWLFYKELLFYSFDPLGAKASGLPVNLIYMGLIGVITLAIVAAMQTVGVLLVMALLVGPAMAAYLWVKELHHMMIGGAILGAIAAVVGMYGSYWFDLPSGPAIVMVIFGEFFLSWTAQLLMTRRR